MLRLKFFLITILLALLFILVTASKVIANKSESKVSTPTIAKTFVDQKKARLYELRREALQEALNTYFEKAIQLEEIVGAGVSIVQGDSIVISEGFGKRSVDGNEKIDEVTIFRLGSLSKGFAGVLAADLKSEGKIDWDDKITDYISEFQLGNQENTDKIKLAHILSHTSGAPYHSYTNLVEAGLPMATIAKRFHNIQPIGAPGQLYSYQNAMFALFQEVVLKVTGQAVTTELNNRFFKPLGMSTVSMDYATLMQSQNVAMPHYNGRQGWKSLPLRDKYFNAVLAGGIDASSLDMAKWMRFLLGHNPEVMQKTVIQEVFKPFIELNENNKYYQRWPGHIKSSYGYGWRIHTFLDTDTNNEITIWHHGGSVNNYRNEIALYPDADLGICVLLNCNSKLARTVIPDLYEIIKNIYKETTYQNLP